jgi:hypothetical protein
VRRPGKVSDADSHQTDVAAERGGTHQRRRLHGGGGRWWGQKGAPDVPT